MWPIGLGWEQLLQDGGQIGFVVEQAVSWEAKNLATVRFKLMREQVKRGLKTVRPEPVQG